MEENTEVDIITATYTFQSGLKPYTQIGAERVAKDLAKLINEKKSEGWRTVGSPTMDSSVHYDTHTICMAQLITHPLRVIPIRTTQSVNSKSQTLANKKYDNNNNYSDSDSDDN